MFKALYSFRYYVFWFKQTVERSCSAFKATVTSTEDKICTIALKYVNKYKYNHNRTTFSICTIWARVTQLIATHCQFRQGIHEQKAKPKQTLAAWRTVKCCCLPLFQVAADSCSTHLLNDQHADAQWINSKPNVLKQIKYTRMKYNVFCMCLRQYVQILVKDQHLLITYRVLNWSSAIGWCLVPGYIRVQM